MIAGAALAHVLFAVEWFKAGPGEDSGWMVLGWARWPVLAVAALAILATPATAVRRSAASSLAVEVVLTVAAPVALGALVARLIWPPQLSISLLSYPPQTVQVDAATATGFWLGASLTLAIWMLAIWGCRDESRGFSPDPGTVPQQMRRGEPDPTADSH